MNKIFSRYAFLGLAAITLMFGCEKNAVVDITRPYDGALFKVYNFAFVRSNTTPYLTFNSYVNDIKFAAILSTTGEESADGLARGGLTPTRGYSLAPSGNVTFKAFTPKNALTNATTGFGPNLEIASVTANVQDGKNYTFYVCGEFTAATKKADGFIIEDVLPAPDTAFAYVRLVNPAPNTNGLSLELTRTFTIDGVQVVDVTTPINGVRYKSGSEFVKVTPGIYTLRCVDSPSGKFVNRATATALLRNRIYTFTVRGDLMGATSYPTLFLDFTENR